MADGSSLKTGELSCSVCLGGFREPKVLPCCHSFCLQCLEGALEKSQDQKNITCPQCRTQHQVPASGVCGFLTDYTLICPSSEDRVSSNQRCEQCEQDSQAVAYCVTCSDYLCSDCLQGHKRYKPLKQHETVDLTECTEEGTQANRAHLPKKMTVYTCGIHDNEPLKLFCKTCKTLACLHCFILLHNGHDVGSIDTKRRRGLEKNMRELIRDTRVKLKEFEGNLHYIKAVQREKKQEIAPLKTEVNTRIDSLITQLERKRDQLFKDIEDAHSRDIKELWAQKEFHETAITHMRGALSFAKRSLACEEHIQLFAVSTQVMSRLKQLSQLKWDCKSTESLEMSSIRFGNNETDASHTMMIDCKALGDIHRTVTPPELDIMSKDIPSSVVVGSSVELRVKATLRRLGKELLKKPFGYILVTATATVQRKERADKVNVRVFQDGDDFWTLQFTPMHKGTYSVSIEAQGAYGAENVSNKYRCNIFAQR